MLCIYFVYLRTRIIRCIESVIKSLGCCILVICDLYLEDLTGARRVTCALWGAGAPARGNTGQERGNMGYGTEEQHICLLCRREIYSSNK